MTRKGETPANAEPSEIRTTSDDWFEDAHQRFFGGWDLWPYPRWVASPGEGRRVLRAARTDVTDSGTSYTITAEIPGIPKEKLDIRIRGASVEIRGESGTESSEKEGAILHRERSYQGFYRSLELPEPVKGSKATAKVENGVLVLQLPKLTPMPSPAEVRVNVG